MPKQPVKVLFPKCRQYKSVFAIELGNMEYGTLLNEEQESKLEFADAELYLEYLTDVYRVKR